MASRRGSEVLIRAGRVTVNGRLAKLGESADPEEDVIRVDGRYVEREPREYWLVNKPRGVVTTVDDPQGRTTILDLVPNEGGRLYPVGRLDRDSEGLVLLTNDGELTHALLHPSRGHEREYRVRVRGRVDRKSLAALASGVRLEDGMTAPAKVGPSHFESHSNATVFTVTLREGRNRQIRRSLNVLGHEVIGLCRVRMGTLHLGRLAPGSARRATAREKRQLLALARSGGG
ncbi:rRNA pseudouridine synthase [Myxococcota bacterium]|nr:rRNA pseudouridine synthase [Myxococcota bacterium]